MFRSRQNGTCTLSEADPANGMPIYRCLSGAMPTIYSAAGEGDVAGNQTQQQECLHGDLLQQHLNQSKDIYLCQFAFAQGCTNSSETSHKDRASEVSRAREEGPRMPVIH